MSGRVSVSWWSRSVTRGFSLVCSFTQLRVPMVDSIFLTVQRIPLHWAPDPPATIGSHGIAGDQATQFSRRGLYQPVGNTRNTSNGEQIT